MQSFLAELPGAITPALVALFGTLLTIILRRAAEVATARWGIEIEARHREALHSAILSGLQAALSRGRIGDAAIDDALVHVAQSVPDALAGLPQATGGVLRSIAESKLREVGTAITMDGDGLADIKLDAGGLTKILGVKP